MILLITSFILWS